MYTRNMKAHDSICFFALLSLACLVRVCPARAQSTGELAVGFVDEQGIPPASDIYVTLASQDQVRQARTDKAGKVVFTALPFQTYELDTWSASFADISLPDIQITTKDPKVLNVPLKLWTSPKETPCPPPLVIESFADSNFQVAYEERKGKAQVSGLVAEIGRSRPLKEATITLVHSDQPERVGLHTTSDASGLYEFKDIEPGKYTLAVTYSENVEKSEDFNFWVTRENLTRIGRILFGISLMNDNCGTGLMIGLPEKPSTAPELIPPRQHLERDNSR
jgi:Carboxypeptidase regulatory-like domain